MGTKMRNDSPSSGVSSVPSRLLRRKLQKSPGDRIKLQEHVVIFERHRLAAQGYQPVRIVDRPVLPKRASSAPALRYAERQQPLRQWLCAKPSRSASAAGKWFQTFSPFPASSPSLPLSFSMLAAWRPARFSLAAEALRCRSRKGPD